MRVGKQVGMEGFPVEKRVGCKNIGTKAAEGFVVFCRLWQWDPEGMGSSGVLFRNQRLAPALPPGSSPAQALSSEAEICTRLSAAKLPGATRNVTDLLLCSVRSYSSVLSTAPLFAPWKPFSKWMTDRWQGRTAFITVKSISFWKPAWKWMYFNLYFVKLH